MTTNLSFENRELIQSLRAEGLSLSEISRLIGLSTPEMEGERQVPGLDRMSEIINIEWFMLH